MRFQVGGQALPKREGAQQEALCCASEHARGVGRASERERERETERERERESWCFRPSQAVWLYQGDERERERAMGRERERARAMGRERDIEPEHARAVGRERESCGQRESWCFTPSQAVWLYQGDEREKERESVQELWAEREIEPEHARAMGRERESQSVQELWAESHRERARACKSYGQRERDRARACKSCGQREREPEHARVMGRERER